MFHISLGYLTYSPLRSSAALTASEKLDLKREILSDDLCLLCILKFGRTLDVY